MLTSPCRAKVRRFLLLFGLIPAIVLLCMGPSDPAQAGSKPTYGGLVGLDACQLERLFACAEVGCPPVGFYHGRLLLMAEDRPFPKTQVALSGCFWKGKHFAPDGHLTNQFVCRRRISTDACIGPSWYDGKPCVAIDYAPGTPLFGNVRDEFRQIGPGLYIGRLYQVCPRRFLAWMCLELDPCKCARPY